MNHLVFDLLLCLCVATASAAVYNTSGPSCSVPHPLPEAPIPPCAGNASATLQDAQTLASRYAPVVHFHPLEPYYLQNIDDWYNATDLYLTDLRLFGNSSYDFIYDNPVNEILLDPRTFITILNSTKITSQERDALLAGAPFDSNNQSTAKVFYTVVDFNDGYWVYNYNLFYAWNGCSNQAIALSINGSAEVSNYIMCPAGVHEADLERVSVLVCKADLEIKRVAYSQHSWVEVRDCTVPGECPRDPATGNLVTYAGLEGHGNFPEESPLNVYMVISGDVAQGIFTLENLGGVYIADRPLADPYKRWVPSSDKLVYIPPPEIIYEQNLTEFDWALYGGNWGAPLQAAAPTLTCINENQTELYTCPTNNTAISAVNLAVQLLNILPIATSAEYSAGDSYAIQTQTNSSVVGYPGIPGPMTRGFSYTWSGNSSAPIQTQDWGTLTCPEDILIDSTVPPTTISEFNSSITSITGYIIGIVVGGVVFSLVLMLILTLPILLDKTTGVQAMAVRGFSTTYQKARLALGGRPRSKKPTEISANMMTDRSTSSADFAGNGPTSAVDDEEVGTIAVNNADTAILPQRIHSEELKIPSEADFDSPTGIQAGSMMTTIPSVASTQVLEVEMEQRSGDTTRKVVWLVLGVGLFISGLVLSAIGLEAMFNNSIVSTALDQFNLSSVGGTLLIVLSVLLGLMCLVDVVVILMLVFMRRAEFRVGRWKMRNPLGEHTALSRRSFEMAIVAIGLMTLNITITTLLFALAFTVTIVQLGVRIVCKQAFSLNVFGQSVSNICITVPFISENQICGWEVLSVCGEVTNMDVRLLMLGSALLLWTHVIWLIALAVSLEGYRDYKVVMHRQPDHDETTVGG